MIRILKRLASLLPSRSQQALKRLYFGFQIRGGRFSTNELEYGLLSRLVAPGDWILDVGANIGHYTLRCADLVGPQGRVVAFEPIHESFELLTHNVSVAGCRNVTLVNAAASSETSVGNMLIPNFESGLSNFYMAHLTSEGDGVPVLCVRIDGLKLTGNVRLVKIDAEGHEVEVLRGMKHIIERCSPVLVVEDSGGGVPLSLMELGYDVVRLNGSSNFIGVPREGDYSWLLEVSGARTYEQASSN